MARSGSEIMRREATAFVELAQLQRDPVFRGAGLPRGDGRLVLVLPGLFGNDVYLQPLHQWLRRLGYSPVNSSLSLNAGCPQRLRSQIETTLQRHRNRRPGPLAVIGHSRGGMLGWAIASHLQAEVSHLALLGSPAPAVVAMMRTLRPPDPSTIATSRVANAGQRWLRMLDPDCDVPACGCAYVEDLRTHLHPATRVLSVYSRDDPVVSPAACPAPGATNVEVSGTHSGLVYNRAVYPPLARFLAS